MFLKPSTCPPGAGVLRIVGVGMAKDSFTSAGRVRQPARRAAQPRAMAGPRHGRDRERRGFIGLLQKITTAVSFPGARDAAGGRRGLAEQEAGGILLEVAQDLAGFRNRLTGLDEGVAQRAGAEFVEVGEKL